jgi:HSP20 family molecular chaperone IbpA
MATAKWAPFRAFTALEQEMHLLLDRLGARPWAEGFGWKPDTDIFRHNDEMVVEVELPGLDPTDDLEIDIEGDVLQVSGVKSESMEADEVDRLVRERRCGPFRRCIMLPSGVIPYSVSARYEKGVLTVRIPLPEASEERTTAAIRIPVEVGGREA